jgi:hypothetical protein
MRRKTLFILTAAALVVAAQPAAAQFGFAAKAGTTGIGGEASYGLSSRFALRASATVIPANPTFSVNNKDFEIDPPSPMFTAGADLYLTGGLRLFGGALIGADQAGLSTTYSGTVTFGEGTQPVSGSGRILVNVESSAVAPFAGIGFGRTFGSGVGLMLDLGAAMLGESTASLQADGPITQINGYEEQRRIEEQKIQEKVDKYAKILPMVSLGLRVGLGSR